MRRLTLFWAAFWAVAGLFFWTMDRRGKALCGCVRWAFRTETRRGRAVFTVAYTGGALLLYAHLLKGRLIDRTVRALDRLHA